MFKSLPVRNIFFILFSSFLALAAQANPCGDLVYNKYGKFRKYEVINLTLSEAIKKHGISSTSGATTETSTASTDPGVSTGGSVSWKQSLSTDGPCKWGGVFASQEQYHEYIAQNMEEIKKEMAVGEGGHLEVIASVHGCQGNGKAAFPIMMQKHFMEFVDYTAEQSRQFDGAVENLVSTDLKQACAVGI